MPCTGHTDSARFEVFTHQGLDLLVHGFSDAEQPFCTRKIGGGEKDYLFVTSVRLDEDERGIRFAGEIHLQSRHALVDILLDNRAARGLLLPPQCPRSSQMVASEPGEMMPFHRQRVFTRDLSAVCPQRQCGSASRRDDSRHGKRALARRAAVRRRREKTHHSCTRARRRTCFGPRADDMLHDTCALHRLIFGLMGRITGNDAF
jgi:hypothetical protein